MCQAEAEQRKTIFAYGLCFYKIALLLVVGAFLGDIVETIFCRVTAGVWMSRSSFVWGPFSIVWGVALAAATMLLYRYRKYSDRFLFFMGTFLGGAYEYTCSVLTEMLFGKVFWDYSKIPFNLGGRINLLYCFFWGIAAVAWIKGIYPVMSAWIEKIPINFGKAATWLLLIFFCVDMAVSGLALVRSSVIKARFSSNGWVLAELFLVFIVMWFLCDSLGCMKYTFYRPLGYNIEHVYKLSTVVGGESRDTSLTDADKYLGILAKLEQEPSVEAAALCYWSLPMSGSNSYNALVVQDTSWVQGRCIYTTGGYMDVFRISEDPRHPFRDTPAGWNNVTLSNAAFERFCKKMPEFSQTTPLGNGDSVTIIKQMGKTGAFRSYRYGVEEPWFFYHLGENMIKAEFADNWSQIVFRVKPAADGPDYREKFLREIAPKLDTDNAFVADAAPYTEQQLQFEVMNGDTDKVNSQAVVVLFLLVNVFLGLIGTFWFRTRRRRSEIALRMTMGSTRGGVFRLLIGEGLLLLALVTLPAMVVCYNVGMAEFTIGRTSLISTWPIEWSVIRFLAGSLGAWLLIALMVVIGIWFPARQAMKIEPAEALHEE